MVLSVRCLALAAGAVLSIRSLVSWVSWAAFTLHSSSPSGICTALPHYTYNVPMLFLTNTHFVRRQTERSDAVDWISSWPHLEAVTQIW